MSSQSNEEVKKEEEEEEEIMIVLKKQEVMVEVKHEVMVEVKHEVIDRESKSKGCLKCTKTNISIFKTCICCWRFCLNSCEVAMDCNIRCCTCAKSCLERIDCDETP